MTVLHIAPYGNHIKRDDGSREVMEFSCIMLEGNDGVSHEIGKVVDEWEQCYLENKSLKQELAVLERLLSRAHALAGSMLPKES